MKCNKFCKELYMFPPILIFNPNLSKQVLSYRTHNKEALAFNAQRLNAAGWSIPFDSAFTLTDVTHSCCKKFATNELHINGIVSFAARQYWSATRDLDWLLNESGNELINKIAEFWDSKMTFSDLKSQFEILNVIPPDENVPTINNSVFTNIIASMSIFLADYSNCLANKSNKVDRRLLNKARCIFIPYDQSQQYHLEYENYNHGVGSKIDVVLLGFPLMWPMDHEMRKKDLWFYEGKLNKNHLPNLA